MSEIHLPQQESENSQPNKNRLSLYLAAGAIAVVATPGPAVLVAGAAISKYDNYQLTQDEINAKADRQYRAAYMESSAAGKFHLSYVGGYESGMETIVATEKTGFAAKLDVVEEPRSNYIDVTYGQKCLDAQTFSVFDSVSYSYRRHTRSVAPAMATAEVPQNNPDHLIIVAANNQVLTFEGLIEGNLQPLNTQTAETLEAYNCEYTPSK